MNFFNSTAEEKYRSIIHRERPCPDSSHVRRPRMPLSDRAKIFAPFSTLKGYEEVIKKEQQERLRIPRPLLAEDELEQLSRKVSALKPGCRVRLSLFQEDTAAADPPLGYLRSQEGRVKKIDPLRRTLTLKADPPSEEILLSLDDILDVIALE